MTSRTTRSTFHRAMLEEGSDRGPVAIGGTAALGGPDVSGRGFAADLPIGLIATQAGLRVDQAFRMVATCGTWRSQATLGHSYPGEGTSWFEHRPRASRIGPPSSWCSPQVAALERELEWTRRELREALRAPGVGAKSTVEAAQARHDRSRTIQRGRAEATEDVRRTCREKATTDLPRHVHAVAPADRASASMIAAIPGAPRRLLPTTPDERAEPTRRLEFHLGPTVGESIAIDDAPVSRSSKTVFVVVDDDAMDIVLGVLRAADMEAVGCSSGEAFLRFGRPASGACLLTGACIAGVGGLELVDRLRAAGSLMPIVVITGRGDVPMAVRAMRAGASDVIEEPVGPERLLTCVERALEAAGETTRRLALRGDAARHVAGLTPRQREIMASVLAGHPSKNIAADLGISRRTVENHRASIMRKTGARSLPALTRLAIASEPIG